MALNPLEPVVFNEGEPLDPSKLNKLQTNISNTYETSAVLYNNTVGQQTQPYIPIMNCGNFTFDNLKAGVRQSQKFDPGTMFVDIPHVVVGVRSNLRDKHQVSASIINLSRQNGTTPEIVVVSSLDMTTCRVEWIALEKRAVSA